MGISFLPLFLYSGLAFAASAPTFPVLTYSTYLRDNFTPKAIATDSSGNIYLAGTAVVDPATGQTAALVVKLNPQTSQFFYARYLGGSHNDSASALAVDSAGNAYVAGAALSADFPVTAGGTLGAPPSNSGFTSRSFVAKLDPNGEVVFSEFLGGSAISSAQGVAVSAAGQILVSGSGGTGFPSTPGAYVAPQSSGLYLMELDPTGAKTIFSALGIGGSALAFDSAGNIYIAGSTTSGNYPTTPGAYQTKFPTVENCSSPDCAFPFPGSVQYVTKVDPTGSKLIYSTGVTGTGDTGNAGMAVDAAGDVYITGFAGKGYPYSVPVPTLPVEQAPDYLSLPFLSKLDPAGQTLLFSVPVGGAGVQLDSAGNVYVGGSVGQGASSFGVPTNIPVLASVPAQCLPNSSPGTGGHVSSYVAEVDGSSGNLLGSKFIGGFSLNLSRVALVGSTLWIGGSAIFPDFPFTPNALTLASFGTGSQPGAYLGAVDFSQSQPPAGTPQIGCIVDAADLAGPGPVARNQLLTIFGTGLGPVTGVSSNDNSTTSLGGASITFGPTAASPEATPALAAPLLYISSTQINFAVPPVTFSESFSTMQLTINGLSAPPIELPLTQANPSLFPVVLNADGSFNSSLHAAASGSKVSLFVNGLSGLYPEFPQESSIPLQLFTTLGWPVTNIVAANPFVVRVDLQVPGSFSSKLVYCTPAPGQPSCVAPMQVSLYYFDTESGFSGGLSGPGAEESVYVALP